MTKFAAVKRPILITLVLALASPALAQNAGTTAEARLRKLEAEVTALQRQVFPGGDGKYFAPQVQAGQSSAPPAGTPASTPVTDLLARMDAVEAQMARITAQGEENANRIAQLEARLAAAAPAPAPATDGAAAAMTPAVAAAPAAAPAATPAVAASTDNGAITSANIAAMSGGASSAAAAVTPAAKPPATAAVAAPAAKPAAVAAKPAAPAAKAAAPSAQRVAAVKAIEKPQTKDAGDDEYSYGFRLWDAKFYPEAQQQLKLFLQKYPKHERLSYARNLLGRAYLDEGNPREAASWFLQNYQAGKTGDRAPDSLLLLAESMRQLKDTKRACVALAQFVDDYPREAAGRLKSQYDATRAGVKCN